MDIPGCQNTFRKIPTQLHTLHTLPLPRSLAKPRARDAPAAIRTSYGIY